MANWLKIWGWLTVSLMALTPIQVPLHHWTCHSPRFAGSTGDDSATVEAEGLKPGSQAQPEVTRATCRGCLCHGGKLERAGSEASPGWNSADEDCQVCFQLAEESPWLPGLATSGWGDDLLVWHAMGCADHQYASHDMASCPRGPPLSI